MGTRFNDPEGTGEIWSLNPNVVKSNLLFSSIDLNSFITRELRLVSVSNCYSHYSSICANGQQTYRQKDRQSYRQTEKKTRQTERLKNRKTDRKTDKCNLIKTHNVI